jgi:hypothetical protein
VLLASASACTLALSGNEAPDTGSGTEAAAACDWLVRCPMHVAPVSRMR